MTVLRCVIVSDESSSVETLKAHIDEYAEITLVGVASQSEAAVSVIASTAPDVLFLEVEMREFTGFDLLRLLAESDIPAPAVIFIAANEHYALQAFEASAIDYLVKPMNGERLRKAVRAAKLRIGRERANHDSPSSVAVSNHSTPRIAIRSKGGKIVFLKLHELDWVKARGNYLLLRVGDQEYQFRETMQSFEARVTGLPLARIHRSAIVNIDKIKEVEPWYTGEHIIRLLTGDEFTLSRTYRDLFFKKMGGIRRSQQGQNERSRPATLGRS